MDKKALLEYALFARKELETQIALSLNKIGIYDDHVSYAHIVGDRTIIEGISESFDKRVYDLRKRIADECLKDQKFSTLVEEFAYTWFNRIIAIRFMEVHDYFPHGFRVLTNKDDSYEPEILKNLSFVLDELKLDSEVIQTLKEQNKIEELYRYVLIKQCNALNPIFPELFDKQESYLEYLLPNNLLGQDSVIRKIKIIPDEDFLNDVEVVGWLYQFYNSVKKDEVFASKETITKDTLPAVTQLFTPDWIVRYMADNSVGRLWLESYPESSLKDDLKYYVEDAEQEEDVKRKIEQIKYKNVNPEDIRVIEPCCGSGHILVYVFDLIYKMYLEKGYNSKEIPSLVLKNNLYGLDVDKRAAQLANFSLVMKARSIDNRFFTSGRFVSPNVFEIKDSQILFASNFESAMASLHFSKTAIEQAKELQVLFSNAKVIGSLLKIKTSDYSLLNNEIEKCQSYESPGLYEQDFYHYGIVNLKQLIKLANVLSTKYDVMITNPPYIGIGSFDDITKKYAAKYYADSKTDMYAMFMETEFVKNNGFMAMINMHSWMFLSSFENLRFNLLSNKYLINMLHLGARAFEMIAGEVVQTTSFVFRNIKLDAVSNFKRLVDSNNKENDFFNLNTIEYKCSTSLKIPGYSYLYWLSQNMISSIMNNPKLSDTYKASQGMATGDNNKYVRFWWEPNYLDEYLSSSSRDESIKANKKYVPYNKGGTFRKWYGNNDVVVYFKDFGSAISKEKGARFQNSSFYLIESLTWSKVCSGPISFRYKPYGHVFDVAGCSVFCKHEKINYLLGILNSNAIQHIIRSTAPTLNYEVGQISNLPVIDSNNLLIENLVKENIQISKKEWDSYEESWDFKRSPLLGEYCKIEDAFDNYLRDRQNDFNKLKHNEEAINLEVSKLYSLEDEIDSQVNNEYVSLRIPSSNDEIKRFISYLVGCLFGRYQLSKEGISYAGGNFESIDDYTDSDGILPIYKFVGIESGLTTEICKLIKKIYGDTYYKQNLEYIAKALGRHSDEGPEETINRYLNEDFYNDHLKIYQKRPIYWLMNSGKNGAFKCLVYMHRYTNNTLAVVNSKYFLPRTAMYKSECERINSKIKSTVDAKQRKELEKQLELVESCQEELVKYGQVLDHMANQYVSINLDDGVKINYCKFQGISLEVNGATIKKDLFVEFGLNDKKKKGEE